MLKIISLGNEMRGDDGIGPRVLERLTKIKHPIPIKFINAGADAFIILEHLVHSDPVIIIDCAKMNLEPGSVRRFEINSGNITRQDQQLNLHGFSLAEVFHLAQKVNTTPSCIVLGIEPKSINFNSSVSPEVEAVIPDAIQLVLKEIKRYEISENFNN